MNHCLAVLCKVLGDFWAFWERDFVSTDRLNWGKSEMLKIWWIWKIGIWSEELVDGYKTVAYQAGVLCCGGQLSGSVSNNPCSLFIWLKISLLFMFTPALTSVLNNQGTHDAKMELGMAAVGFEPTPPERLVPKTSALDHSATLPDIDLR